MRRGASAPTLPLGGQEKMVGPCAYRARRKESVLVTNSAPAISDDRVAVTGDDSHAAAGWLGRGAAVIDGAVIDKGSASASRPMKHHTTSSGSRNRWAAFAVLARATCSRLSPRSWATRSATLST